MTKRGTKQEILFPCYYCGKDTERQRDAAEYGLGIFACRSCHNAAVRKSWDRAEGAHQRAADAE